VEGLSQLSQATNKASPFEKKQTILGVNPIKKKQKYFTPTSQKSSNPTLVEEITHTHKI